MNLRWSIQRTVTEQSDTSADANESAERTRMRWVGWDTLTLDLLEECVRELLNEAIHRTTKVCV